MARHPRLALLLVGMAIPLLLLAPALGAHAARPAAHTRATVHVTIQNFAFSPQTVTVAPGTTVVWTNVAPTPHTVAGTSGVGAGAAVLWTSPIMMTGETYSFTFSAPGTYPIICTLHPDMVGTVVVQ